MLSVVITTWNEAKNLPRAVSSVKGLADEIIVVDTESTDDTREIAKKLGCKVFTHKNTGIVEPVRNFSIAKAKGEWILILDADEEVPATLVKKIREVMADNKADYYRISRKSIIFGKWIKSSHWWPDYVYRLFKKDAITWDDTIHSVPLTRGTGADFPIEEQFSLIHHHYSTISQYVDRLNRYTDHQTKNLLKSGYSFDWPDVVRKPMQEFINQYFGRGGWKEGLHGLALASLQAFSELVLYLKLWQESNFVETSVSPDKLTQVFQAKAQEFAWWQYEAKIQDSNIFGKLLWRARRKLKI